VITRRTSRWVLSVTLVLPAAGFTLHAPLDLLLPDQPADVFRRFAGVDAGVMIFVPVIPNQDFVWSAP
jgi:hypothetical protein